MEERSSNRGLLVSGGNGKSPRAWKSAGTLDVRPVTLPCNRARPLERDGAAGGCLGSRRAMDRLDSVDQGYDSHGPIQMVLPKNLHNRPAAVTFRLVVRNRCWLLPSLVTFTCRVCPHA